MGQVGVGRHAGDKGGRDVSPAAGHRAGRRCGCDCGRTPADCGPARPRLEHAEHAGTRDRRPPVACVTPLRVPSGTPVTQTGSGIRCSVSARGRDAGLVGDDHELGAVTGAQLGERAAGVGLDGGLADGSSAATSAFEALGDELDTSSSRSVSWPRAPPPAAAAGLGRWANSSIRRRVIFGEVTRRRGDDPDRVRRIVGSVFLAGTHWPGPEGLVDVLVEVERGEDQVGIGGQRCRRRSTRRLEAVHLRHADVHQHDVGPFAGGELHRLGGRCPPRRPPRGRARRRATREPLPTSAWSSATTTGWSLLNQTRIVMPAYEILE